MARVPPGRLLQQGDFLGFGTAWGAPGNSGPQLAGKQSDGGPSVKGPGRGGLQVLPNGTGVIETGTSACVTPQPLTPLPRGRHRSLRCSRRSPLETLPGYWDACLRRKFFREIRSAVWLSPGVCVPPSEVYSPISRGQGLCPNG